ncbi:MAG: 2-oxoglutarate dehydrogenase [Candidatus Marinimicrobia bacterium]|nr:2-oxoglutarate dehydrogenase [Candidatus Neomarinimicrobiota bacterium]|tara:strand:- start:26 stop:1315 length:1290 start_codon:yes stop_codon:yes gene_type:complete
MVIDVVMPKMGESITEGTILEWYKKVGEHIAADETLLEIGTDKVDSEIPAPNGGIVIEILAQPNDVIDVGEVIARIETSKTETDDIQGIEEPDEPMKEDQKEEQVEKEDLSGFVSQTEKINSIKISSSNVNATVSPAVTNLANQQGISLAEVEQIHGTGKNGRVTKKDLEKYISSGAKIKKKDSIDIKKELHVNQSGKMIEIDNIRKKISEHMRYSLDTSAHVHIMNEVDMTGVVNFVKKKEKSFYNDEGFSLTYTPFIIYCTVKVLMEMPEFNSSFDGQSQIKHDNVNMGIAVSISSGLMVPCMLKCDEKNLLGICRELNEIVEKTRNGTISPDGLQGSTFTLSNFGIFDALIGTPIINQPNVGILGTGKIIKKPVVIEKDDKDIIAIRNMMMLSLGFDHRLIDGAGGAKFLLKIKNHLENIDFESLL